jgi:hypothetical protein
MYCSKPLSLLQRMRGQRFCCEQHHKAYLAKNEQLAFAELVNSPDDDETAGPDACAEPAPETITAQESVANLQRNVNEAGNRDPVPAPATAPKPARFVEAPELRRQVLDHLPGGIAVYEDCKTAVYFNEPYRRIWSESGGKEPKKMRNAIEKAFQDGLSERDLRIVLRPGKGGTVRIKLVPLPALNNGNAELLMVYATRVLPAEAPKKRPQKALATVA